MLYVRNNRVKTQIPKCIFQIDYHPVDGRKRPNHVRGLPHLYILLYLTIHWGDLGIDGWIILGRNSRRWDVGIWTGLGWPRIETGGGRL